MILTDIGHLGQLNMDISVLGFKDYCSFETFQATCEYEEVILITHAVYGRMKIGKCVTGEFGKNSRLLTLMTW